MGVTVLVGVLAQMGRTPPPLNGCRDCRSGTDLAILAFVLGVIFVPILMAWRRGAEERDLEHRWGPDRVIRPYPGSPEWEPEALPAEEYEPRGDGEEEQDDQLRGREDAGERTVEGAHDADVPAYPPFLPDWRTWPPEPPEE